MAEELRYRLIEEHGYAEGADLRVSVATAVYDPSRKHAVVEARLHDRAGRQLGPPLRIAGDDRIFSTVARLSGATHLAEDIVRHLRQAHVAPPPRPDGAARSGHPARGVAVRGDAPGGSGMPCLREPPRVRYSRAQGLAGRMTGLCIAAREVATPTERYAYANTARVRRYAWGTHSLVVETIRDTQTGTVLAERHRHVLRRTPTWLGRSRPVECPDAGTLNLFFHSMPPIPAEALPPLD